MVSEAPLFITIFNHHLVITPRRNRWIRSTSSGYLQTAYDLIIPSGTP
ncbi:hypothetical protein MKA43_07365 [[Clostridium] innocuum]|nr:hypothetical protein [[Clostridium] innocuum]MCR0186739.1 hypothetical protein [[Clostridium] innocuum]MCR0395150.1 hypothetical protein [[Clostridium] innocuum]MCR0644771.1 hypothetical protein [[Clostridium] innocuum]